MHYKHHKWHIQTNISEIWTYYTNNYLQGREKVSEIVARIKLLRTNGFLDGQLVVVWLFLMEESVLELHVKVEIELQTVRVSQSSRVVWKSRWPSWPSLKVLIVSVDVKQHWTRGLKRQRTLAKRHSVLSRGKWPNYGTGIFIYNLGHEIYKNINELQTNNQQLL